MRAVDTNVLVRIVTGDDEAQTALADSFAESGAWVPQLALAETTWILRATFGLDAAAIAASVDMLLSHKSLTLQEPEIVAAALNTFRKRPALGFTDCLMLEVARKAGHLPLGTFDRGLGRLDGAQRL